MGTRTLSVRLDEKARAWLRKEARRRSAAEGRRIGASALARMILERAASGGGPRRFDPLAFRRKWKLGGEAGFDAEFFDALRDRSPGRAVDL